MTPSPSMGAVATAWLMLARSRLRSAVKFCGTPALEKGLEKRIAASSPGPRPSTAASAIRLASTRSRPRTDQSNAIATSRPSSAPALLTTSKGASRTHDAVGLPAVDSGVGRLTDVKAAIGLSLPFSKMVKSLALRPSTGLRSLPMTDTSRRTMSVPPANVGRGGDAGSCARSHPPAAQVATIHAIACRIAERRSARPMRERCSTCSSVMRSLPQA